MKKRAFTLVEVMVAMAIFLIISGIVMTVIVAGFRSFNQGQKIAQREQRKRFVFFRLGKELSSLTRISYPGNYFEGEENSFFLCTAGRIA
ncbi:MAG: type II secretion system protein [Candidatus Omnitrophica bacterium]|nr:type II secretion system protein [Candidatus Omnitrophota bacterium]MDD5553819.1 type II secretion system protein [Candidatus Omnitrophota bacterium]